MNRQKETSMEKHKQKIKHSLATYAPALLSGSDQQFYMETQKTLSEYARLYGVSALSNLYQELAMANSHTEFQRDISLQKDTIAFHSHTFYEVIFVARGNVQYLLGNRRYILSSGDLVLIAPGVGHRPLFPEELTEPYERYVLWMNAEHYHNLLQTYPDFDYAFQYCAQTGDHVLRTPAFARQPILDDFKNGFHEKEKQDFCCDIAGELAAYHILLKINRLCKQLSYSIKNPAQNELLDRILLYMDENLGSKLSLADTAAYFYVSQSTISHLFRQSLDTSFYQCLMQKRLLLAKDRLLRGEAATKIWAECGFSDYSAFFKAFKKAFGFSPREYAELSQKHYQL